MILSDNETRLDLLNNRAIAKTIISIINDSKESVSIGVHGDWGAGKSSVLAMIESDLKSSNGIYVSDWDEEIENNWSANDDRSDLFPYTVVRFNSWQYQGFEDAKIALMSAIVAQLENSSKAYYKNHKIKGGLKKLKEITTRIWENIDKLSIVKNVGKLGISAAAGTTSLALFDTAAGYIKDIVTDSDKASELIGSISKSIKDNESKNSGFREIEEFRKNYSELFYEAHTKKLIVLIDDLDRCLPKSAIETLEAVRMFLSLDNSAFVVAADDLMIRYSVNEYFPHAPENANNQDTLGDFADKYLEKLIQVPLHIPRIGIKEAQIYIMLLLIESKIGECEEFKKLVEIVIQKLQKPWSLDQLSAQEMRDSLQGKYGSVTNEIMIASNINGILAENTNGNPRNIKRFINMLLLRTDIAKNRGITSEELKMPVLAKMMLIEQYDYDFYKAIAGELDSDGVCHAFDRNENVKDENIITSSKDEQEPSASLSVDETTTTEKKRKKTRTTKEEVKTNSGDRLSKYFEKDIVKKWMRIEPTLANTDLRPYYFVCTEREDFFFESTDEKIRELFSAVNAGKYAMASKKQDIENLSSDEAKILFSKVTQSIFKNNLSDTTPPSQIEGLQQLVTIRTELQESLTDFLLALPVENIGMWAVGSWDSCIPKTSPARAKLCEFYKQISEKNKDRFVKSAATTAAKG